MQDVRQLQQLLEHHRKEGLPAADLQVIRRGKALEYFSRHYGQVYVNDERPITVKEALVGINQLIDEEAGAGKEPPPANAEPLTRQFLRIFDGKAEEKRDQMQKYLARHRRRARRISWISAGARRTTRFSDPYRRCVLRKRGTAATGAIWSAIYDQAMVLIGACFENSGINAADTMKNENFTPRPSLKALLDWFARRGNAAPVRTACRPRACHLPRLGKSERDQGAPTFVLR